MAFFKLTGGTESVATCHGRQIFKKFADITKDYWFRFRSSLDSKRKVQYSGNKCNKI
ncbi:hypothetical protein ACS0TY_034594 [Phlomoides rotata]